MKRDTGITLIALIITVIVLLILAGTAVSIAVNNGDIFSKASTARSEWNNAVATEETSIMELLEVAEDVTDPERQGLKILVNSGSDGRVSIPIGFYEGGGKIDWGDGIVTTANRDDFVQSSYRVASKDGFRIAVLPVLPEHTYATTNSEYTITITGEIGWGDSGEYTYDKILKVLQWGQMELEIVDFHNCHNLISIASPTNKSFKNLPDLYISFSGCTSLTNIPADLFKYCTNIVYFEDTFHYCTSLTSIPKDLFKYCTNVENFANTFNHCTSLTSIPKDLFKYCTNVENFANTFNHCTSLTSIPEDLFKYCTNVKNFAGTFAGCTSLTSIPADLFKYCTNVEYFVATFYNCTSITGQAIELWKRMGNGATYNYEPEYDNKGGLLLRGPDGIGCYYNCTNLTNYSSIPNYWVTERTENMN